MKQILIKNHKYDFKFNYYAREDGSIYSERTNKIMNPQPDKNGYQKVALTCSDGKRHRFSVHRLILENFNPIENMQELQVNHIDGDKTNNCLSNLEWCTGDENIAHAIKTGLRNSAGSHNPAAKLNEEKVLIIVNKFREGKTTAQIAREMEVSPSTIADIRKRRTWKSVTANLEFN